MSVADSPSAVRLSTSFKDAFARPWTFWQGDGKQVPATPPPAETFSEEDSEDSVDAAQANELLYSAQDDIINHDYPEAITKLEKSAQYGNSAACAYLSNILTHGLDCSDGDHQEDRIDANPPLAARWAVRGLEIESGKALDRSSRGPSKAEDAPFPSDIRIQSDEHSTPSATPSEAGPFDMQSAADCASTLTLLFRTRKVSLKKGQSTDRKGKGVDLSEISLRVARLLLRHDALQSPLRPYSQEKLRRSIHVNLLYLIALLELALEHEVDAEDSWKRVVAIGQTGPIGDNTADELVGNARRRLTLLHNQHRGSMEEVPRTPISPSPQNPPIPRRSSTPMQKSHSATRKATFQFGNDSPVSPDSEKGDPMASSTHLSPPSPRTARELHRSRLERPSSRVAKARFPSLKAISCVFRSVEPQPASPSVALEAASAILPPQEKLRSRTSVLSLVHAAKLPPSKSMLFNTLRRDVSAASLPDLAQHSHSMPVSPLHTVPPRVRAWTEMGGSDPTMSEAIGALRRALSRHDALLSETDGESEDVMSGSEADEVTVKDCSPFKNRVARPSAPMPKSMQSLRIRGVDPALAKLEDASRVNVLSVCAVCDARGVNFPKCPKCRKTYCSRACRIGPGGGDNERHVCQEGSSEPPTPQPELATPHTAGARGS